MAQALLAQQSLEGALGAAAGAAESFKARRVRRLKLVWRGRASGHGVETYVGLLVGVKDNGADRPWKNMEEAAD